MNPLPVTFRFAVLALLLCIVAPVSAKQRKCLLANRLVQKHIKIQRMNSMWKTLDGLRMGILESEYPSVKAYNFYWMHFNFLNAYLMTECTSRNGDISISLTMKLSNDYSKFCELRWCPFPRYSLQHLNWFTAMVNVIYDSASCTKWSRSSLYYW